MVNDYTAVVNIDNSDDDIVIFSHVAITCLDVWTTRQRVRWF